MDKSLKALKKKVSDISNRTYFGHCFLTAEEEQLVKDNFNQINVDDCDLSLEWYPIFLNGRTHIGGTYGTMSMASLGYKFICFDTMQIRGETIYEYYHKNDIQPMANKKAKQQK